MKKFLFCLSYAFLFISFTQSNLHPQFDSTFFSGMKARSIGPAGMSGRIASIDAVKDDRNRNRRRVEIDEQRRKLDAYI